jgi:predicted nucleic acid-binding protein
MFLDTSVIVEILSGNRGECARDEIFDAIGADPIYVSVIQFAELADICLANGVAPERRLSQIADIATTVPLDAALSCEGARIKNQMRKLGVAKFGLIDGIILASARSVGETLLTMDTDFRKARDALVIAA